MKDKTFRVHQAIEIQGRTGYVRDARGGTRQTDRDCRTVFVNPDRVQVDFGGEDDDGCVWIRTAELES